MTLQRIDVDQSARAIRESLMEAEATPLIITKHGQPFAALVPLPNTDAETASLSLEPEFLALIERSRTHLSEEGSVSASTMEARFS